MRVTRCGTVSAARAIAIGAAAYGALDLVSRGLVRRTEMVGEHETAPPGTTTQIDGLAVHHLERGEGPPVVLVHGYAASSFSYRETIPALAPRFRVLAVDLPGFGYSDRSTQHDMSLDAQVTILRRWMGRLRIGPALVVGHSLGGAVAMRLAAAHPELVERLVLVGSIEPDWSRQGGRTRPLLRLAQPLVRLSIVLGTATTRLTMRRLVYDERHLTRPVLAGYRRPRRIKGSVAAIERMVQHTAADRSVSPAEVHQPALLLWGDHDRTVPLAVGERLAQSLPNAELAVIRQAGHLVLEERPSEANAALLRWIEQTDPSRDTEASRPFVLSERPAEDRP